MARVPVLLNRGGGAVAADPQIAGKVAGALAAAGVDAKVELVGIGDWPVRCRAIAQRDKLLVIGGGEGKIRPAPVVRRQQRLPDRYGRARPARAPRRWRP